MAGSCSSGFEDGREGGLATKSTRITNGGSWDQYLGIEGAGFWQGKHGTSHEGTGFRKPDIAHRLVEHAHQPRKLRSAAEGP